MDANILYTMQPDNGWSCVCSIASPNNLLISSLICSWIVSFSLAFFHLNDKVRKYSKVLFGLVFAFELAILLALFVSTSENASCGNLIFSIFFLWDAMDVVLFYSFLFMMVTALRLLLLDMMETVAKKLDASLASPHSTKPPPIVATPMRE